MSHSKSSDEIKELVLAGKINCIIEKFGEKKFTKAEEYAKIKLKALKEKIDNGVDLIEVSYATPFMRFAVKFSEDKLEDISLRFERENNATTNGSNVSKSQLTTSTPTAPLTNTPSQSSAAVDDTFLDVEPPIAVRTIPIITPVRESLQPHKQFQSPAALHNKVQSKNEAQSKQNKIEKEKPASSRKTKKHAVDQNAPKGVKGAYMYFSSVVRSEIISEDSSLSFAEISKETSMRWKSLSEDLKQSYLEQAAADKLRYDDEMNIYKENHPDMDFSSRKEKKPKKKDDFKHSDEVTVRARGGTKRKSAVKAAGGISKAARGQSLMEDVFAEDLAKVMHNKRKKTKDNKKAAQMNVQDDLLHTNFNPRETCAYPPQMEFSKGKSIVLILEPYRAFLSSLPLDAVDTKTMQDIQRICSSSVVPTISCTIKSSRKVVSGASGAGALEYTLLGVCAAGKDYKILHADFCSPLLTSDTFLLEAKQLKESLVAPWIVVNAQVRRMFATESPDVAEWQEGSVYFIETDLNDNPYGAVKVAWLQQEKDTNAWIYAYTQTDSDCSPWDLELSSYVLLGNIRPPTVPRALLTGTLDPDLIIEYLKSFDSAEQFMEDMTKTKNESYIEMFPDTADRLDLIKISRFSRQGRYSEEDEVHLTNSSGVSSNIGTTNSKKSKVSRGTELGVLTLFLDLQRMIAQSKQFNFCNACFLPWRLADMMDCAIRRLKITLAKERDIACLLNSVMEDRHDEAVLLEDGQAMDV